MGPGARSGLMLIRAGLSLFRPFACRQLIRLEPETVLPDTRWRAWPLVLPRRRPCGVPLLLRPFRSSAWARQSRFRPPQRWMRFSAITIDRRRVRPTPERPDAGIAPARV